MKFYRFEMTLDGEPQYVGFLTGLEDVGLPLADEMELEDLFGSLPCPHLGRPCEFWFTEKGLATYADSIDAVLTEISEYGWGLIAGVMENDFSHALYYDELQAAWAPEYLDTDCTKFIEIQEALDIALAPQII